MNMIVKHITLKGEERMVKITNINWDNGIVTADCIGSINNFKVVYDCNKEKLLNGDIDPFNSALVHSINELKRLFAEKKFDIKESVAKWY